MMILSFLLVMKSGFSDNNGTANMFPFLKFPSQVRMLFWPVCSDSLFSDYPGLPDMKQIGTQHSALPYKQSKQTGSTEIVPHSAIP
jgi:hypothetical protein